MISPHHFDLIKGVTWDDKLVHWFIGGVGLSVGSLIKVGFDKLAEHFWDTEWKEFRKWKAEQQEKK